MNILTLFPSPFQAPFNQMFSWYQQGVVQRVKVSLTSAQILLLHGTPVLCVASPGAGYAIRVLKASASLYTSEFSAYAANMQLALYTSQTYPQALTVSGFLGNAGAATDANQFFNQTTAATGEDNPIAPNAALYVYVPVGNPTTGDSPVDLYISYEILAL